MEKKIPSWLLIGLAAIITLSIIVIAKRNNNVIIASSEVKTCLIGEKWREIKAEPHYILELNSVDGPIRIQLPDGRQYLKYPDEEKLPRLYVFNEEGKVVIPALDPQEELSEIPGSQVSIKSWITSKEIKVRISARPDTKNKP